MDRVDGRVAIVIVNFNGGSDILRCLEGIQDQTFAATEVIVVDNNSTDGSREKISEKYPTVKLIQSDSNNGFAKANNIGIQATGDCDWIALLNPDAWPEPEWLAELMRAVNRLPDTEVFSSRLLQSDNPHLYDGTGDIYHVSGLTWRRDHGQSVSRQRPQDEEIFSPCAAAAMYKKDRLVEVGGFDENYFCYIEDIDLVFRMRLLGVKCRYVEQSIAHHVGSSVTGKNSDFSVYHGHRNLVWTYFKNMPSGLLWYYLPQHILLNLVSLLFYTFTGKAGVIIKSKYDAIKGLPRILKQRKAIQSQRKISTHEFKKSLTTGVLKPYIARHK